MNWKKMGCFVCGTLFGTAGISILKSKDAMALYTQCTAAVLRGRDQVMKTYETVKENCGDILEDAKDINEERYAKAEELELEKAKALVEAYESETKPE